ncbi:MAG: CDP-diacylglycerol--glycerol-3-phosphate 3-phosphatidyltransferase [Oscillospiraceae bacterium]|nr:CDP-diacylglycerol--glycerol-3-phosphate 3-phosphatidyltransferase [Oscillospiraceae bacterium]
MKINLPNKLTLMRICIVPVFMLFMLVPVINETWSRAIACAFFLFAALTDFFDGRIARKLGLVTDFGKFLDPVADKFMIFGALFAICASDMYRNIYPYIVIAGTIVIFRELAVTSLRLVAAAGSHEVISANILGKLKTLTQSICVVVVILEPIVIPQSSKLHDMHLFSIIFIVLMTVMTIWSGLSYFKKYINLFSPGK